MIKDKPPGSYSLSSGDQDAVNAWEQFVKIHRQRLKAKLPGFPLWTDYWVAPRQLKDLGYEDMPPWKQSLVDKNVTFYQDNKSWIDDWRTSVGLQKFSPSRRKLEWQAGDLESLHDTAMQLRPSGIRVKAPTYLPALVAITQTSVLGPQGRRLTPRETARLQGFPDDLNFGDQPEASSYKQTGNAVAVGAVWHVFREHVLRDRDELPGELVAAVEDAALNPIPGLLAKEACTAQATDAPATP